LEPPSPANPAIVLGADHDSPFQVTASAAVSTTMQNVGEVHETDGKTPVVPASLSDFDQAVPLKV
jgi:hypothetical protein